MLSQSSVSELRDLLFTYSFCFTKSDDLHQTCCENAASLNTMSYFMCNIIYLHLHNTLVLLQTQKRRTENSLGNFTLAGPVSTHRVFKVPAMCLLQ